MYNKANIDWLWALNQDLWPEDFRFGSMEHLKHRARRTLSLAELQRVCQIIEEDQLITSMFSASHFGGYGMRVYEDPVFSGDRPQLNLTLTEDHMPPTETWEILTGTERDIPSKHPGRGRSDAWELFSRYTHSERNQTWLRMYGLPKSEPREHYDY